VARRLRLPLLWVERRLADGQGEVDVHRLRPPDLGDRRDDLSPDPHTVVDLVRGDPKNLVYFLQEDRANPGHFIFYEVFASEADFDAHNAMPYVKAWFAKLPELADGGVEVMRMAVLGKPKK